MTIVRRWGLAAWSKRSRLIVVTAGCLVAAWPVDSAPETVRITVPASVGFAVTNVGTNTSGNPATSTVSFSSLNLSGSRVLQISVKADGDFVPPGGPAIPASKVSWTTSAASNGTGSGGTLSVSSYAPVFKSAAGKKNGSINLNWVLAPPGTPLRAGNHMLTVRWKLEAINP